MKDNELQLIWKSNSLEPMQKTKEELTVLLTVKAKQALNKFLVTIGISVLISIAFLLFLIIASANRSNDSIYVIHNITLGAIVVLSLFSALFAWYKLQNGMYDQPLKKWLAANIKLLTKSLSGKAIRVSFVLIPFINILTVLSIHIYFENRSYMDVLQSGESVAGLVVGVTAGLVVAFYLFLKIKKYQLAQLNFLKDLYNRICSVN